MPKFPPPPPWHAQNRSLLLVESQTRTLPSASTILTDSRLSQVRPYWRDSTPTPPPNVSPASPTVGQEPPGTASPSAARRPYRPIRSRPAPIVTVPAAWVKELILLTSMISPPVTLDHPA